MTKKMLMFVFIAYILLALRCVSSSGTLYNGKVLLCYYAQWATWRKGYGIFRASQIDPSLCTHIVYAHIGMNETTNELMSRDPTGDYEIDGGLLGATVRLKSRNPNLSIMICVGGWSEGSVKFSEMADSYRRRKTFIKSVINFLRENRLDGMDLSWEYPADRGGSPEDKRNFVILLEELRNEFDKEGYILTTQINGQERILIKAYDIPKIAKAVHYISLVTYQYHHPKNGFVGLNSPLKSKDHGNVEFSVNYVLSRGAPANRVLLGLSTFGHPFVLDDPVSNGKYIGVPSEHSYEGPWSHEEGFMGYNEICYVLKTESGWQEMWDDGSSTPYAVNEKKLMTYDNKKAFIEKLKLLRRKGLGGAMVWSIDTDDFRGLCSDENYPLINTIKSFLLSTPDSEINVTVISEDFK